MTIMDRILSILENNNQKMVDLTRFLGLSTSTTSNWKTKNRNPPAEYIAPICEFLGVSPLFLLTGSENEKVQQPSLDNDQLELLSVYDSLDNEGKTIVKSTCYQEKRRLQNDYIGDKSKRA